MSYVPSHETFRDGVELVVTAPRGAHPAWSWYAAVVMALAGLGLGAIVGMILALVTGVADLC